MPTQIDFNEKIRNKMLIRILAGISIVLITLGCAIYFITKERFLLELKHKSEIDVSLSSSMVNTWLEQKRQFLSVLASTISKQPYVDFSQTFIQEAIQTYDILTIYMGLTTSEFFDGSGWVPPAGYVPQERPWYLEAVLQNKLTFISPYKDTATGKMVITISTPVRTQVVIDGRKEQKLIGVLAMDILLDSTITIVDEIGKEINGWSYLVEKDGTIIAGHLNTSSAKTIRETKDSNMFTEYLTNNKQLSSFKTSSDYVFLYTIPHTQWIVVSHIPLGVVNAPLRQLLFIFLAGFVVTLLVLTLTISWISRLLAKPIQYLSDKANGISSGNYEDKLQIPSHDEIGFLTHNFNKMADGLKDREFIKATFGRYVSADVAKDILNGGIELGGEQKNVTILIADIRNFTSISEKSDPTALVSFLNDFFSIMDEQISKNGGYINKYLGDGFLAVFGAPEQLDNPSLASVIASIQMLDALTEFNAKRLSNIRIGIGIHTGDAVVGNIGSQTRMEYTVIGDTVNIASRIEGLTKIYVKQLLISATVAKNLPDTYLKHHIDKVRVKGKKQPVELIAPMPAAQLTEGELEFIEASNQIMMLYHNGSFIEALQAIEHLQENSSPHLLLIRDRCLAMSEKMGKEWDGIYSFQ